MLGVTSLMQLIKFYLQNVHYNLFLLANYNHKSIFFLMKKNPKLIHLYNSSLMFKVLLQMSPHTHKGHPDGHFYELEILEIGLNFLNNPYK
jgi:hypothetical protein